MLQDDFLDPLLLYFPNGGQGQLLQLAYDVTGQLEPEKDHKPQLNSRIPQKPESDQVEAHLDKPWSRQKAWISGREGGRVGPLPSPLSWRRAAGTSPSLEWGRGTTEALATRGCLSRQPSSSAGITVRAPQRMASDFLPLSHRKPPPSTSPKSPVPSHPSPPLSPCPSPWGGQ